MTTKKPFKTDCDEFGLLPYPVIAATMTGDPEAIGIVFKHYEGIISDLSIRKLRDARGNTYYGVDKDIYDRLRSRLIRAILDFKV